jgi:hypothetical protein
MCLKDEIEMAKIELKHAEKNLDMASEEFIDSAIKEYDAKMAKLNTLYKKAKENTNDI